jgi:hypothetical protein
MGNDTRIGVDVAKAVFEVAVSDRPHRHQGILQASRNEDMHRLRSGWRAERTARINALRGLLFAEACLEIRAIEARVKQVERQLDAMAAPSLPASHHQARKWYELALLFRVHLPLPAVCRPVVGECRVEGTSVRILEDEAQLVTGRLGPACHSV